MGENRNGTIARYAFPPKPKYNENIDCYNYSCVHQVAPNLCSKLWVALRFVVDGHGVATARCNDREETE